VVPLRGVSVQSYCYTVPIKKAKLPLSKTHPKLAKEADGWDPSLVSSGSHKKVKWICTNGHRWEGIIRYRTEITSIKQVNDCTICNSVFFRFPKLAKEADGWDPSQFTFGSNKKQKWKCKLGHNWLETPNRRINRSFGCPYCSGQRILKGFNDLETTHPDIAKQAHGWDPTKFSAGSNQKLEWICRKKHTWITNVSHRTDKKATNCPVCSGFKIVSGVNDLQSLFPKVAKEAFGWDPSKISPGSNKKYKWICKKGHTWDAIVVSRTSQKTGCPVCVNREVISGFNDLKTLFPAIARDADGWDPREVGPGTAQKMNWECKLGHKYKAQIDKRTKRNQGCPLCANKKILIGFNDLVTTHPNLALEAFGWDPSTINAGRGVNKDWKCSEGHIWSATPVNRTSQNSGCPSCAEYGFIPDNAGYLYFLNNSKWNMYQIGITNSPDNRVGSHKKLGWELLELRGPMDGHVTAQWETAILRMLKAKGADLSNSKIAGKFDGFTEAWSKSTFPVKSIKELMRLTEEFEEN
jgi:hypothetical protein